MLKPARRPGTANSPILDIAPSSEEGPCSEQEPTSKVGGNLKGGAHIEHKKPRSFRRGFFCRWHLSSEFDARIFQYRMDCTFWDIFTVYGDDNFPVFHVIFEYRVTAALTNKHKTMLPQQLYQLTWA
jgi:hypothetical protein